MAEPLKRRVEDEEELRQMISRDVAGAKKELKTTFRKAKKELKRTSEVVGRKVVKATRSGIRAEEKYGAKAEKAAGFFARKILGEKEKPSGFFHKLSPKRSFTERKAPAPYAGFRPRFPEPAQPSVGISLHGSAHTGIGLNPFNRSKRGEIRIW